MAVNFSAIGKVGDYLKQSQLQFAAKHKIKTGQTLTFDAKKDEKNYLKQMVEANKNSSASMSDTLKTAVIKNKLQSGRELSSEEMNYLKKHDESLYRKAKGAEDAREDLKRDLRHAHTKAEARQALMRAQLKAAGEAMAELSAAKSAMATGGGGAGGVGMQIGAEAGGTAGAAVGVDGAGIETIGAEAGNIGVNVDAAAGTGNIGVNVDAGAGEAANVAGTASGTAATVSEVKAEAKELPPEAQKILGRLLQEINAEVQSAAESEAAQGAEAEQGADGKDDGKALPENSAAAVGQAKPSTEAQDILEKLLYKLKAIARAWEEYTKSDAYKELPEDYTEAGKKEEHPQKTKASAGDISSLLDQVVSAKTGLLDAQPEAVHIDISQ